MTHCNLSRALATAAAVLSLAAGAPVQAGVVFDQSVAGLYTYTVLTTGTYHIDAYGAQGGGRASVDLGGLGAHLGADFVLTVGDVLRLIVGGQGNAPLNGRGAGGGGGSFVLDDAAPSSNPLLIAGGGGGGGVNSSDSAGANASITTSGTDGKFRISPFGPAGDGGAGGTAGSGGGGGTAQGAGGGGGLLSAGGEGGFGLAPGGSATGGAGGSNLLGSGGFGGGGAPFQGGGGGGGYSGGGGGGISAAGQGGGGGGGGSFSASLVNFTALAGARSGNGRVVIELLDAVSVPAPSTAVLLALGLAVLAWRRRSALVRAG